MQALKDLTNTILATQQLAHNIHLLSVQHGDHLLADRLGDGLLDEIDTLKELSLSYDGDHTIAYALDSVMGAAEILKPMPAQPMPIVDMFKCLKILFVSIGEQCDAVTKYFDENSAEKAKGGLAIQNAVQSLAEKYARNIYLINQRLEGRE